MANVLRASEDPSLEILLKVYMEFAIFMPYLLNASSSLFEKRDFCFSLGASTRLMYN
jgi:hypothetical protein